MELRCNINCGGGKQKITTFLNVPPNGLELRGNTNARANERERTSTPPPSSSSRHRKRRWAPKRHSSLPWKVWLDSLSLKKERWTLDAQLRVSALREVFIDMPLERASLLEVHHGRHLVEQVNKCATEQYGNYEYFSLTAFALPRFILPNPSSRSKDRDGVELARLVSFGLTFKRPLYGPRFDLHRLVEEVF
eukprot:scaffold686_cov437-Pavlova_lutheri.AAC.6